MKINVLLQVLFKRVLKGEVSPADLVRMTAEELASKELAAWRQRENRHVSSAVAFLKYHNVFFLLNNNAICKAFHFICKVKYAAGNNINLSIRK